MATRADADDLMFPETEVLVRPDPWTTDVSPRADRSTLPPAQRPGPAVAPLDTALQAPPPRLVSLDAYRGLVMVLMVSAGLGIGGVVRNFERTSGWQWMKTDAWTILAYQTDHPEWAAPYQPAVSDPGVAAPFVAMRDFAHHRAWGSLWDQIQPSFMFMVGAALAFSLAARKAKGHSFGRMLGHALVRSLLLVLLGIFLASNGKSATNWSFTIVLGQIGLGYPFLFLLAWLRPRWQLLAAALILGGYFAAFALYPRTPDGLDPTAVNLPANWHWLTDFAGHWDKNTNLAARVDQWFLNLFPRADGKPFSYESGGYQTLNFVPSLATMIFGLLAGELIRGGLSAGKKVGVLVGVGFVGILGGWALGWFNVCPLVKRIWTPSWAVYSAGWAFLMLGLFYLVIDVWRLKRWAYPLVVVGANSIAVYCISMTMKPWVKEVMRRHFGRDVYDLPGRAYAYLRYNVLSRAPHPADTVEVLGKLFVPMAEATFFLLFCWVVCWWMYRKKFFIKI